MFSSAMATASKPSGIMERARAPAAATPISMRHSSEKLSLRPRTSVQRITKTASAATPSWCSARSAGPMEMGSPAG